MIWGMLIWNAVVPALLAGGVMLVGLSPWRAGAARNPARGRWAAAVALAAGYVAGQWGLGGLPPWDVATGDVSLSLMALAVIGAAVGVLDSRVGAPTAIRWLVRLAVSGCVAWLLLRPLIAAHGSHLRFVLQGGLIVLAVSVLWTVLDFFAAREQGPSLVIVILLLGAGGSTTLALSGAATTAQLGVVLLAALGALLLVLWWAPAVGRLRSAIPVVALVTVAQWTIGLHYAEMPVTSFVLLAGAPIALLLTLLSAFRTRARWLVLAVRLLVIALPIAAAVATSAVAYFDSASSAAGTAGTRSGDGHYGY